MPKQKVIKESEIYEVIEEYFYADPEEKQLEGEFDHYSDNEVENFINGITYLIKTLLKDKNVSIKESD